MKNKKRITVMCYVIGVLSIVGIIYELVQMFAGK